MGWAQLGPVAVRAALLALCAGGASPLAAARAGAARGLAWAQAEPSPTATPTPAATPTVPVPSPGALPVATPSAASSAPAPDVSPAAPPTPASSAGAGDAVSAAPSAGDAAIGPSAAPPANASTAPAAGSPPLVVGDAGVTPGAALPDVTAAAPNVGIAAIAPVAGESGGPGRVLYADNFANAASGWPVQSSDATTRRVGYANSEYYVTRLPGSGGSPYVMREERFGDFSLQVDARLVEPTLDAYVFVDFRRQDGGEHYSFVVAPDEGAFIVRRNTDRDGATVLDWTRAAAIHGGTATNRLGVRAQGGEVTLFVNGEEVGRARADELGAGGVGFGVGSLNDGPAEARFGNLVVASVD